MRKLVVLALVLVTVSLGVPAGVVAQAPARAQLATISGEAVDAGGRALIGERVELLRENQIVGSTITGSRGEWLLTNVMPGDYVVRVVVNGTVAGVRVSVAPGQTIANTMIVAPGAAAPSAAFIGGLGVLGGTLVVGGIAAAIITTAVLVTGS